MIKAVIFDMDGTTINTQSYDFSAWGQIFRDHGKTLTQEEFKSFLGNKAAEIIRQRVNPTLTKEAIQKEIEKKDAYFATALKEEKLTMLSGLEAFLTELKKHNYKTALATGADISKIRVIENYIPVSTYFSVIVHAGDIQKGKPDPEVFLLAAKKLGVLPQECLVVEDSPNGIEAAHNARMRCIAITTTHEKDELQNADKIIDSFDELTVDKIKALQQ